MFIKVAVRFYTIREVSAFIHLFKCSLSFLVTSVLLSYSIEMDFSQNAQFQMCILYFIQMKQKWSVSGINLTALC